MTRWLLIASLCLAGCVRQRGAVLSTDDGDMGCTRRLGDPDPNPACRVLPAEK